MATYFVDDATGNDADDGLTEGNAFKTIDKAMNTVAAADKVWVKSTNDYTETATIDTAGTITDWIVFEGYTSTTGDGGKATIDGASTRTNGIITTLGTLSYRFENFIIKNHTGDGFSANSADSFLLVNCEFNNNGGRGINGDNAVAFINCSATGNTTDGFGGDIGLLFIRCTAHNNTVDGFQSDGGAITCYNCVASSNGDVNFYVRGTTAGAGAVLNCTADGDGKDSDDGLKAFSDDYVIAVVNSIFYDCTDGIDGGTAPHVATQIALNNLINSNTNAYTNWNPTGTDVTGAPNFTAEGSQDYTLGAGSAAIDAGADYSGSSSPGMDIGAHQAGGAVADNVLITSRRRVM